MSVLEEAEKILAGKIEAEEPVRPELEINTCYLDHQYCFYQKKCRGCPKMGGR